MFDGLQRKKLMWLAVAFFKVEENIIDFKTRCATRGVMNFYNAGVVSRSRRIGSSIFTTIAVYATDPRACSSR
jgi:hypothetical protein